MTNQITIREINANGTQIVVTADETGSIYVNGRDAGRPVKHDGVTFVWGSVNDGLPMGTKIGLTSDHIFKIDQHSHDYRAKMAARNAEIRKHDAIFNEGGYGYNPHA